VAAAPKIDIFCSSNRPQLWPLFCRAINRNNTKYKLIVVGPIEPDFILPEHVTFIYSTVKPAQCFHVASTHCHEKYILGIADDVYFYSRALDYMVDSFYYVYHPNKAIVSAYYTKHGMHMYHNPDAPVMPFGNLMTKEFWDEIGGIDRNFVGMYWDADIAMRAKHQFNGQILVCRKAGAIDDLTRFYRTKTENWGSLTAKSTRDFDLFNKLWHDGKGGNITQGIHLNANVRHERTRPAELFEERDDILTVSQGPKGQWK